MTFHEKILSELLLYKETHPEFRFIPRQRNTKGRLEQGFWFQGNENYAFVGLIDRSGGSNMTRSVGLVFWETDDYLEFSIEIVHKNEKDIEILNLYEKLKSQIGEFTEANSEKFNKYIGDTSEGFNTVFDFLDVYYPKIVSIFTISSHPNLIIDENKFQNLLSKINSYRIELKNNINKLLINITWNSKDWKEESSDASNHRWVKDGGTPGESLNFAKDAEGNTEEHIYGYAKFTHQPKIDGSSIFIFYSQGKIVGFYGNAELTNKELEENIVLNLKGDQKLSFVLHNKIDNAKELGFLEDKERVGMINFNYLEHDKTVISILNKALELNPNQETEILRLKSWFIEKTNFNENNVDINKTMQETSLNQILYGPPGTGKTYHTINKALSIIENKSEEELQLENRKDIKNRFDGYLNTGQIVFSTFHQSMSYEDFIEGIKPIIEEDENENKQVLYDIVDGLFKQIVERAKKERTETKEIIETYNFDDAWNDLVGESKKQLEENVPLQLSIQTPHLGLKVVEVTDKGNLKLKPIYSEQAKEYLVSFDRTKKLQNVFSDLSMVKNIDKEFRAVIGGSNSTAYWSVLNYINNKINSNKKSIITEVKAKKVPHVLIIDEINRGNVSQIFGELITLIEEDKRLGKDEALEVTLPYSKKKFGVPPNLYIIGTMNTADRSVEALDTALRRRFSFEEMMPKLEHLSPSAMYCRLLWKYKNIEWEDEPFVSEEKKLFDLLGVTQSLLDERKLFWEVMKKENTPKKLNYFDSYDEDFTGINLKTLLETINNRIEVLLDRDHTIGHSYFIKVNNVNDLKHTFKNNIIPLLQEYFYGDYEKIGLVLGKGFFEEAKKYNNKIFASFDTQNYPENGAILRLKTIDTDFDIIEAIKILLSKEEEKVPTNE
ncbi:McrB family protein [Flavobacterium sp. HNIBRBA15423]|uniref:McrB family protein n=1 Tax=Flavobacterium sp. HNIBRBA15423 TaxID=3458683 RepID=UPI004044A7DB